MKLFTKAPDGGNTSGVTGYFLVEIKPLFSIVLLHFNKGTRDAFHSHAFNAITLWLKGHVRELLWAAPPWTKPKEFHGGHLKVTRRDTFHKVEALRETWALSIRGPWAATWREARGGDLVTLTHGRKEVQE